MSISAQLQQHIQDHKDLCKIINLQEHIGAGLSIRLVTGPWTSVSTDTVDMTISCGTEEVLLALKKAHEETMKTCAALAKREAGDVRIAVAAYEDYMQTYKEKKAK